jgi:hypothetical protein
VIVTVAAQGNSMNGALANSEISTAERDGSIGSNADLRRDAVGAKTAPKGALVDIEAMTETCRPLGFTPKSAWVGLWRRCRTVPPSRR